MLRRMSLMGDAMSHAILPGAAIGYLLARLVAADHEPWRLRRRGSWWRLLAGPRRARDHPEARTRASPPSTSCRLRSACCIISVKGSNIDLLHVLFGTVLALDDAALLLVASITTVSSLVLALIYRPLVLECFDPQFLRSVSSTSSVTHLLFLVLVVLNLVSGFQALGTLMAVGIMLLPAITARFWARTYRG